jgi:ABC-type multidrug transport system ATPase subunit
MANYAINVEDLRINYGKYIAVSGVTLRVPVGCVYALLGPNGAGKTSVIRSILSLKRISEGKISILGGGMPESGPEALQQLGYMPDPPSLYAHLSADANLRIAALLRDIPLTDSTAVELFHSVGLRTQSAIVRTYSQGMRQKLGLAMALLGNPKLIILDEPTNGLDPIVVREFRGLVARLVQEGCTIFLSSHQLTEVERMATHIGVLCAGRMVFEGEIGQFLTQHAEGGGLEEAFFHALSYGEAQSR